VSDLKVEIRACRQLGKRAFFGLFTTYYVRFKTPIVPILMVEIPLVDLIEQTGSTRVQNKVITNRDRSENTKAQYLRRTLYADGVLLSNGLPANAWRSCKRFGNCPPHSVFNLT